MCHEEERKNLCIEMTWQDSLGPLAFTERTTLESLVAVSTAVAAKTKSQDLGGWSNRNIFSSQSQRLEVQDQGICKAGSFFFQLTFLTSWASQVVHKRLEFDPRIRKIPWRKKWQPTTVFLCGESHGERSLVGS